MPQTLYRLGVDPSDPGTKASTPTPIVRSLEIKILWISWCDLVYSAITDDFTRSTIYLGTSLNAAQQLDLQSSFLEPEPSDMRQSIMTYNKPLRFFGTAMHDGLRGHVASRKVTVYGTLAEKAKMGEMYRDVDSWDISHGLYHPVAEVSVCSDGSLLVARRSGNEKSKSETVMSPETGDGGYSETAKAKRPDFQTMSSVANLQRLQEYCALDAPTTSIAQFAPTQLVVNATTATALDEDGRVHTRTTDPRYPACLGRSYTGTSTFEPVPYLSETRIVKIASGGYMTAAISEDGELFLWGQANPGTEGELGVLHRLGYDIDAEELQGTVIWGESMQDQDVKCLNIHIDSRAATAYDVAIGSGHVLVAAKNDIGEHVVLAAGCGEEGQLGLEKPCLFQEEFEEAAALRGKRVIQLVAAGWSSYVVVDD